MAIREPCQIGERQGRAVFAVRGRAANLVPQWPLNPVGKNSEYLARCTITGSG